MAKVKDIAMQIRGVSYHPEDLRNTLDDDSIVLLRANNIKDGKLLLDDVVYVSKSKVAKQQYLQTGDILICASSGSKELVGKAAFVDSVKNPMTFGAFCKVVRPQPEYSEFLGHYFNSPVYRRKISALSAGANINNIKNEHIDNLDIQLVDEKERREIITILNKLNMLISLRKQQLFKLDELVKARFVEMFGKASLLAQNQTKRLEECCISISGGNTPSMQHPEYYGGNIPFVKSGDVKGDYIVESTLTLTKAALTETTAKILPKSTLIVVIRSAALLKEFRIGMLMVDAVINQDLKALQVSEDFLPVYLMWAIKMQHQVLLNKVQTMLTSHIRMEDLLNLKIGTPPLSLQNQFADFVERVNQQKQTVQQSLEKLELMKKALMQEYFG